MRIELGLSSVEHLKNGNDAPVSKSSIARTQSSEIRDNAALALNGEAIAGLTANAMAEPELRSDRVEHLRSAMARGLYQVNPSAVAESMFHELF